METGINFLGEWEANEKEIIKNLSIIRSEIKPEAIHDTRVAIKKLRAYCELLNELDKSAKIGLPQTKSLFDILGKHREWGTVLKQLQKAPGNLIESCSLFVTHIHQAEEQISHLIKNAAEEYDITEPAVVNKKLAAFINTLGLHKAATASKHIIMRHVAKLKTRSIHFKKEPHYTRKSLKVIFYWINLFPPESLYAKKQVKRLEVFLDKLGKWHDMEISRLKIKNYRKDYLVKSLDEYQSLKKLEADTKSMGDKIFNRLKPMTIINELNANRL